MFRSRCVQILKGLVRYNQFSLNAIGTNGSSVDQKGNKWENSIPELHQLCL